MNSEESDTDASSQSARFLRKLKFNHLLGLYTDIQSSACLLIVERCEGIFKYLRQHRGQHSPSGTVALEQGMRGQDTFRHIVAEFCKELKASSKQAGYKAYL